MTTKLAFDVTEIEGDMWEEYLDPNVLYVVTTNGSIKNNGEAVMGRGTARDAKNMHPRLPSMLGDYLQAWGNVPFLLTDNIATLPVKHDWKDKQADEILIMQSVGLLCRLVDIYMPQRVYMPRPGCGNGRLTWEEVQPLVFEVLLASGWPKKTELIIWHI